jgi:hypothetical protein
MRKSFGGIALAIGPLTISSASALAYDTPQSQAPIASKIYSTNKSTAPLTQIAACMPQGSSCNSNADCCNGNCDPKHNKCGR